MHVGADSKGGTLMGIGIVELLVLLLITAAVVGALVTILVRGVRRARSRRPPSVGPTRKG